MDENQALIATSYKEHFQSVLRYISRRINNVWDAENLAQDVWVRLLTYEKKLTGESIVSIIITIARNLVNDYLRKLYTRMKYQQEVQLEDEASDSTMESAFVADNLAAFEQKRVECLPTQRRIIYTMSRYEDKSVSDIARDLLLSTRTVENHLRMGRNEIRSYMASLA